VLLSVTSSCGHYAYDHVHRVRAALAEGLIGVRKLSGFRPKRLFRAFHGPPTASLIS
jgi:hypothetical protein